MSNTTAIPESTMAAPLPQSPELSTSSISPASPKSLLQTYRTWLGRCTQVCEDAARANLEMRLLHAGQCGHFVQLMDSINHLLEMTDAFMRESHAALQHASEGSSIVEFYCAGCRARFAALPSRGRNNFQ